MNIILIQGAEKHETNILEEKLENKEEIRIGEHYFIKGKYGKQDVVISRTMVGEINASSATTIGILEFNPKYIINQGTAGSHSERIHTGDIVIGTEYIKINSIQTSYLEKGEGVKVENWTIKEYSTDDRENLEKYNKADEKLLKNAKNIIPQICNNKVYIGIIGSGDIWNREIDRILYLNNKYNTLCEEMETAAVYKVANKFNIPAISIRIISNNEIIKEKYNPEMATKCQEIIYEFVKSLK